MRTVRRRRPLQTAAPEQSPVNGSAAKRTCERGAVQRLGGGLIEYDLTDVSVFEVEREDDRRPPEPLPTPTTLLSRTRDLLKRPRFVAALGHRYGLTPDTLRRFGIGLEWRQDGPWISIPIWDDRGALVNVRRRYFGRKPELHQTGRKYRNLTGRGEPRLYPAWSLPPAGSDEDVLVCCGEFDALVARQVWVPAVTSTGGASNWCARDERLLDGYHVTVTYDRGEEEFAERVAARLGARAIHLPSDLPTGTDLAALYAERGTDGLRSLLRNRSN